MKATSTFDWIRTTDKVPPAVTPGHLSEYTLVTVAEQSRYVDIDRYDHRSGEWETHGRLATHWQPLPSPVPVRFDELPKL